MVYLSVLFAEKTEVEKHRTLALADVRFFLSRLAQSFTGSDAADFAPSNVQKMAERYADIQKEQAGR